MGHRRAVLLRRVCRVGGPRASVDGPTDGILDKGFTKLFVALFHSQAITPALVKPVHRELCATLCAVLANGQGPQQCTACDAASCVMALGPRSLEWLLRGGVVTAILTFLAAGGVESHLEGLHAAQCAAQAICAATNCIAELLYADERTMMGIKDKDLAVLDMKLLDKVASLKAVVDG